MYESVLTFRHASSRDTKAYVIYLGQHKFYISYETIVGYKDMGGDGVRLKNEWGPTTGRHIREMGISDFPIVSEDELRTVINRAVATTGHQLTINRLEGRAQ